MHMVRSPTVPPPPRRSDVERRGAHRAVTTAGPGASPGGPTRRALRVHPAAGRR